LPPEKPDRAGVYLVGDKLPAERFMETKKASAGPWFVKPIIMLEVEGYVEVRKGSGIHVISNQPRHPQALTNRWNLPTTVR
jgi:GntR family hexuronate regulon transcriptional repressor